MLKRLLFTVFLFFTICIFILVLLLLYWRIVQKNPTDNQILFLGILFPLGFSLLCSIGYFLKKGTVEKKEKKVNHDHIQQENEEIKSIKNEKAEAKIQIVKLYSPQLNSSLGHNGEIILKVNNQPIPIFDTDLFEKTKLAIFSSKIQDLKVDENDQKYNKSHRIKAMIKTELIQQKQVLEKIALHFMLAEKYYRTALNHQYRIHPKWKDMDFTESTLEIIEDSPVDLKRLDIHIILSDQIKESLQEHDISKWILSYLDQVGIIEEQVEIFYLYQSQQVAYEHFLNIIKSANNEQSKIDLVIFADSGLDVEELTYIINFIDNKYAPCEFSGSLFLIANQVDLLDMNYFKKITFTKNNLYESFTQLNLLKIEQYNDLTPFFHLINQPPHMSKENFLEQYFAFVPIQTNHLLNFDYSLGDTKTLQLLYQFMFGVFIEDKVTMHFDQHHDDEITVIGMS
ncbi:hypothetical protein RFI36_14580 [Acinetobacter gerneri]|uniref:Transmembrane protein n=1 Tax=Acinetobacter gerneri TaxID=202952 RepID=A0AAW8JMK5_9GAMM|nr:hypothetical protein [Acinetobacter gerneri]MDQ9010930.1 hypothetical protein [Acinetobacter gerneri]MDQ9015066.1 hypothetical protein [Acinetobacter gerneri]MDQ9026227.1 hypothetical protein [Acinetobacter gerneri]MDQ9053508.1 hypothetical protein [Acinetobacter gerneri]MDQ9061127.1 hypothetical protein [Acinetobacter gerneri]